ncbi:hypothetical protein [Psychrobacter aestuarii]|uniref:Uncharacterized protein n=1 Tax=Psychrobacter aestuarii TaxID=556327 RepID=A0ABP3FR86_9GAMM|nr:hypothetical protein [Psychrobacter aestuarii]
MSIDKQTMDAEERKIEQLAKDINPSEDITPDSEAEMTTALLDDDALGGTASEKDKDAKAADTKD